MRGGREFEIFLWLLVNWPLVLLALVGLIISAAVVVRSNRKSND